MSIIRSSRLSDIGAFAISLCLVGSPPCRAEQASVAPAERVEIPVGPLPFALQGWLRRPERPGRSPAVVLLASCSRSAGPLDSNWGARISSWGYVTLTLDSFGPRGIKSCGNRASTDVSDTAFDAYRGLHFLVQRHLVEPRRVALVGFAAGAWQALSAIEPGAIEHASEQKFRAAAVFYPPCGYLKGIVTVPTLVLVGERDDWVTADACRKMVAGEDDMGISRQKGEGAAVRLTTYPNAYFGFDVPALLKPTEIGGHHLEFNRAAADQSSDDLRTFLAETIGIHQQ